MHRLMIRRSRRSWQGGAKRRKRTERGRRLRLQDRGRLRNRRHAPSNRSNRQLSLEISSERMMSRNVPQPRLHVMKKKKIMMITSSSR